MHNTVDHHNQFTLLQFFLSVKLELPASKAPNICTKQPKRFLCTLISTAFPTTVAQNLS